MTPGRLIITQLFFKKIKSFGNHISSFSNNLLRKLGSLSQTIKFSYQSPLSIRLVGSEEWGKMGYTPNNYSTCSIFECKKDKNYLFWLRVHRDTLQIQRFSTAQNICILSNTVGIEFALFSVWTPNTVTFEYDGILSMKMEMKCLKLELGASCFSGSVWTVYSIHSAFAW